MDKAVRGYVAAGAHYRRALRRIDRSRTEFTVVSTTLSADTTDIMTVRIHRPPDITTHAAA
ncbi:hypothetical protein ACH4UM_13040 [Streptomyces sp. NPDC020801]|uniref:hypothetical protein n=1 Tax=unclassified Streptomyces TaxID=2593676 RepID=UPI00379F41D9